MTLPKQWTERVGLKGGDELDIEETEKGLAVSSEKTYKFNKIKIDATNFNERVTRLTLSAAHKAGFDEIEIIYEDPFIIKVANELVKELYMGFSIVEQTSKRCVLKSIASDRVENFNTVLRRAFLVSLTMADSSLDMLEKKQFNQMESLISLEHFNNQLTNFCERVLNKKGYKDGNCFYYVVAWNLEKVCDNYKYICKLEGKKEVSKKILDYYKKVNKFFRSYYDVFYKFNSNELVKLTRKGKSLKNEAINLHRVIKNEFEFAVVYYLMTVVLQCLDFSASYIAINTNV